MDETDFASVGELATTAEDGSATIDKENLQKLFDLIGDDENTSFSKIQSFAAEAQTSADFRLNTYCRHLWRTAMASYVSLTNKGRRRRQNKYNFNALAYK